MAVTVADPATLAGLAAGVATSVLFTLTTLCFTAAGRRLGSTRVNATRIYLAVGLLLVTQRLVAGSWMPSVEGRQLVLLGVSGVLGLTIGDHALFTAFLYIGPRLSTLMMTTAPLLAALFGWVALGETLSWLAWAGVLATVAGVAWVVLERPPQVHGARGPRFVRGVLLAFVGAACQAGGLLLSKQGMGHGWLPPDQHLAPQAATLVRMIFAALGALPMLVVARRRAVRSTAGAAHGEHRATPDDELREQRRDRRALHERRQRRLGYVYVALGAVVGPYLGVWMSLVASDRAPLGIAQTLCSLVPVFILPAVALVYREAITARALLGAVIAVGGAALLFVDA